MYATPCAAISGAKGTATTPAAPAMRPGVLPKTLMISPTITDDQMPTIGFTPAICAKAIDVGTLASAVTTPLSISFNGPATSVRSSPPTIADSLLPCRKVVVVCGLKWFTTIEDGGGRAAPNRAMPAGGDLLNNGGCDSGTRKASVAAIVERATRSTTCRTLLLCNGTISLRWSWGGTGWQLGPPCLQVVSPVSPVQPREPPRGDGSSREMAQGWRHRYCYFFFGLFSVSSSPHCYALMAAHADHAVSSVTPGMRRHPSPAPRVRWPDRQAM